MVGCSARADQDLERVPATSRKTTRAGWSASGGLGVLERPEGLLAEQPEEVGCR
jgi:hypothetical protein